MNTDNNGLIEFGGMYDLWDAREGYPQVLGDISSPAMSRIFKRLRLHGIIDRVKGSYKYFPTAYGKEIYYISI